MKNILIQDLVLAKENSWVSLKKMQHKYMNQTYNHFIGLELTAKFKNIHRAILEICLDLKSQQPKFLYQAWLNSNLAMASTIYFHQHEYPNFHDTITNNWNIAVGQFYQTIIRCFPQYQTTLLGNIKIPLSLQERKLDIGLPLSLDDLNPLASLENHPEKNGNKATLGEKSFDLWQEIYNEVFNIILETNTSLAREMKVLLKKIIPVGWYSEKHFSASFERVIGQIYVSLHQHPLVMLGAIIHEFQHNKLYLASHFDKIMLNGFDGLYTSPVRPDPRPLWGILLAVHAFLPVEYFFRELENNNHPITKDPRFTEELKKIITKNNDGMKTLNSNGVFTETGREFFESLLFLQRSMR